MFQFLFMFVQPKFFEFLQPASVDQFSRISDLCTQIDNILTSYDDQFDAFAEALQNSVDAVFARWEEAQKSGGKYAPKIRIFLDYSTNRLRVIDNGCGVSKENFEKVFRPNCSLKRILKQSNARGEKGAAVVFLQFGHRSFVFETKRESFRQRYTLQDGAAWFATVMKALDGGEFDPSTVADPIFSIEDVVDPELDALDTGSAVTIEFGDRSNLRSLAEVFGADQALALKRLEYILRTRTALGFVFVLPDRGDIPQCVRDLEVDLQISVSDGSKHRTAFKPGFMYPHELASLLGSPASLMTNPRDKSELLYDYISAEFIQKHFENILKNHSQTINKYKVTGYVSYAYNNQYYESLSQKFLGLDPMKEDASPNDLIQINGGFLIAVKEYPNGRRHQFLHRGGSEDKSRTFVVLNFKSPYKPDYGRKNISHDVRSFVNDFCKALMAFATQKERRDKLRTGKSDAPHGVRNVREARQSLDKTVAEERRRGPWINGKPGVPSLVSEPRNETEVIAEFVHYVLDAKLPGFRLYGLYPGNQLDCLFDYSLRRDQSVIYEGVRVPLGVYFPDQEDEMIYEGRWLEFKLSSDALVDDFKRKDGDPAKKYFTLVDLLVCYDVDDATEDYRLETVNKTNIVERLYFGVTHLMSSANDQSHLIGVICLKTLRESFT